MKATAMMRFFIGLPMLAIFSMFSGSGCGARIEPAPDGSIPVLSEIGTCNSFSTGRGPGEYSDTFPRHSPWITCAVKLSDAPRGTKVKSVWHHEGRRIFTNTIRTHGTRWLGFTLKREDTGLPRFPKGGYTIEFFLNDEAKATHSFRVE